MKHIILTLLFICAVSRISAQTYEVEHIYSDTRTNTFLSCYLPADNSPVNPGDLQFVLWGDHLYGASWGDNAYEVEYVKGNARKMIDFFTHVRDLLSRFQNNSREIADFSDGVLIRVKSYTGSGIFALVYDRERKVPCVFSLPQTDKILFDLEKFCKSRHLEVK